jgi:hypothetical protein
MRNNSSLNLLHDAEISDNLLERIRY